jgi:RND family efflux transporter MFP subunit
LGVGGGIGYLNRDKIPMFSAKKEVAPPALAKVEKRDIELLIKASGDIRPMVEVEVKSEVGGKVKDIQVERGMEVKKGDLLLRIDDTNIRLSRTRNEIALEKARLVWEQAKLDNKRIKELLGKNLISQEEADNQSLELATAENSFDSAKNEIDLIDDSLSKTEIRAPIDGTILDVQVTDGQVITSTQSNSGGTTLINMADLSRKKIICHVNQVDIAGVGPDEKVEFTVNALREQIFSGQVINIAPVATVVNNVKGFQVWVYVTDSNPALRPGMTAEVQFQVDKVIDVLSLPVQAVFLDNQDRKVVYVSRNGEVKTQEVEVGLSNFDYAEVKSGLSEGDEALMERPPGMSGRGGKGNRGGGNGRPRNAQGRS